MKSKKFVVSISLVLVLFTLLLSGCSSLDLIRSLSGGSSEPSDIRGSISGQVYSNQAVGFELTYPDGYYILSSEEIDELYKQNIEQFKDMVKDPEIMEKTIQQNIPVTLAFKYPYGYSEDYNPNLNIIVSDLETDQWEPIDYATQMVEKASQMSDSLSYSNASSTRIGNKDAAYCDMNLSVNGYTIPQKQYYFKNKTYIMIISISATEENDMNEFVQIIENIKFYQ